MTKLPNYNSKINFAFDYFQLIFNLYRYGSTGLYTSVNTFTGLKAGLYRIYFKDANGCGSSVAIVIAQVSTTCLAKAVILAKNDGQGLQKVSISPNPSNSQFKLLLPISENTTYVRVLDVNGKVVYTMTGSVTRSYTFGESFATGVYMVEVRQGNEVKTLKAVKIK